MASEKSGGGEKKNMSFVRRILSIASYIAYTALALAALNDIRHRADDEVKGNKRAWTVSLFLVTGVYGFAIPVAPLAYLLFGRKR